MRKNKLCLYSSVILFLGCLVPPLASAEVKLNYSYITTNNKENPYETTISVVSDTNGELDEIEEVIYTLHPTFENKIRSIKTGNNFPLLIHNYGFFTVYAKVKYKNGKTNDLSIDMIKDSPSISSDVNRPPLQSPYFWTWFSGADVKVPSLVGFFPKDASVIKKPDLDGYLLGFGLDSLSLINYNGSSEDQRISFLNFSAYTLSPVSISNLFNVEKKTEFSSIAYFRLGPQVKFKPLLNGKNLVISFGLGLGLILQGNVEKGTTGALGLDFSTSMSL